MLVFVSHSSTDYAIAAEVSSLLRHRGHSCWIAPDSLEPGSNWASAIESAIKDCEVFLLLLSTRSRDSREVEKEVALAASMGKRIVGLRIEDVWPQGSTKYHLAAIHWNESIPFVAEHAVVQVASALASRRPRSIIKQQASWGVIIGPAGAGVAAMLIGLTDFDHVPIIGGMGVIAVGGAVVVGLPISIASIRYWRPERAAVIRLCLIMGSWLSALIACLILGTQWGNGWVRRIYPAEGVSELVMEMSAHACGEMVRPAGRVSGVREGGEGSWREGLWVVLPPESLWSPSLSEFRKEHFEREAEKLHPGKLLEVIDRGATKSLEPRPPLPPSDEAKSRWALDLWADPDIQDRWLTVMLDGDGEGENMNVGSEADAIMSRVIKECGEVFWFRLKYAISLSLFIIFSELAVTDLVARQAEARERRGFITHAH